MIPTLADVLRELVEAALDLAAPAVRDVAAVVHDASYEAWLWAAERTAQTTPEALIADIERRAAAYDVRLHGEPVSDDAADDARAAADFAELPASPAPPVVPACDHFVERSRNSVYCKCGASLLNHAEPAPPPVERTCCYCGKPAGASLDWVTPSGAVHPLCKACWDDDTITSDDVAAKLARDAAGGAQ